MSIDIQALPFDPSKLNGLSEKLINSHHANNYSGAAKRLNAIREQLAGTDFKAAAGFVLNGLKREELIAFNSVILHELYFSNLDGDGILPAGTLRTTIEKNFGSVEQWQTEFTSMGKALGGGSGWVLLIWSARDGKLSNQWASDHGHNVAGGQPILALDMYEHSYHMDFGAKAGEYVDAFMRNINWVSVQKSFERVAA
jgi:superoxide dismutase, Fe-Mn family